MTRWLCVSLAALTLSACGSSERTYSTLEEARADRLFERGWLPEILPRSARDIRVSANLDLNTASRSFCLEPSEVRDFGGVMRSDPDRTTWPREWLAFASEPQRAAMRPSTYSLGNSHWLFLCGETAACSAQCDWTSRSDVQQSIGADRDG
jgi:hypothetical protein